jgi:hypothetical protein
LNVLHTFLICAATLLGYSGELPSYLWRDREPTDIECQRALQSDRFYKEHGYTVCYAVTGILATNGGKPGRMVVIMPRDAANVVKLTEAIRVLQLGVPLQLSAERVYAMAKRWPECSE